MTARLMRLIVLVAALGAVAFTAILIAFGPQPWPVLPWLGLSAACAMLASFPYRINRPSGSYFMDFDEILLVVSLLFVGPAATVGVLVVGYVVGASLSRGEPHRIVFNAGARAAAVSGAMLAASQLPALATSHWDYLLTASVAAAVYTFINQLLVSYVISVVSGTTYGHECRHAARELSRTWPVVVSYGLLVGVASEDAPVVLLLAAVPVVLLIGTSRVNQQRRDENERMRGLYRAAQQMHEARNDEDVIHILRRTVRETLGIEGIVLREEPPRGEELGAWLINRKSWVIVPYVLSKATRRQDEAFLQALASLVDTGIERATLVEELERQSLRDPLTNAFNRRYFHQALSRALAAGEENGSLVLIDVDHFKAINDSFGHEVGDNTLRELVVAAVETFRSNDIMCRLGGDEFALILPGLGPERAVERLEALRERLANIRAGEPETGPVGFRTSMGVAAFPEHGRDPEELLRAADRALYRAKREGRDRVIVNEAGNTPAIGVD